MAPRRTGSSGPASWGAFSGDPKNSVPVCRAVEIVGPRNGNGAGPGTLRSGAISLRTRALKDGGVAVAGRRGLPQGF